MFTTKLRNWMVHEDDAHDKGVIGLLHAAEKCGIDMLTGIVRFLYEWFPDVFYQLIEWLRVVGHLAARIAVRFVRAAAVIGLWLLIVIGPLVLFTSVFSTLWMVIAISGSGWGLWRVRNRRAVTTRPT